MLPVCCCACCAVLATTASSSVLIILIIFIFINHLLRHRAFLASALLVSRLCLQSSEPFSFRYAVYSPLELLWPKGAVAAARAMRQPEMLHSPAYYRDLGRRAPTYPQPVAVGTVSVTVPATSSPWVQPMSLTDNGGTGCSRPSSKASVAGRPESSIGGVGSRGSVLPAQQTFPLSSDAETSLPQPPKSASSHRVGDRSASVAASTSSRVVSSEGRADGTWANRSSYLADENSRKGVVSQIQRQPLQEEDLIAEQEANAVPMIVSSYIFIHIYLYDLDMP